MSTVCLCAFIYCSKNKKCAAEATHKKHTARLRHTSFNTQQGYAKMSLRFYLKNATLCCGKTVHLCGNIIITSPKQKIQHIFIFAVFLIV